MDAKRLVHDVSNKTKEASDKLQAIIGNERGNMGLVPDAIRNTLQYKRAKIICDAAFAKEQAFNAWFVKTYKKEYAEDRKKHGYNTWKVFSSNLEHDMTIQQQIVARLLVEAVTEDQFKKWKKAQQREYLDQHPHSKFHDLSKGKAKPASPAGADKSQQRLHTNRYRDALKSLRAIQKKNLPEKVKTREAERYLRMAHMSALKVRKAGGKLPKSYSHEEELYGLGKETAKEHKPAKPATTKTGTTTPAHSLDVGSYKSTKEQTNARSLNRAMQKMQSGKPDAASILKMADLGGKAGGPGEAYKEALGKNADPKMIRQMNRMHKEAQVALPKVVNKAARDIGKSRKDLETNLDKLIRTKMSSRTRRNAEREGVELLKEISKSISDPFISGTKIGQHLASLNKEDLAKIASKETLTNLNIIKKGKSILTHMKVRDNAKKRKQEAKKQNGRKQSQDLLNNLKRLW